MKSTLRTILRTALASAFVLFSSLAGATTITWTNTAGGIYQTDANWVPNVVPTILDNANFTNNAKWSHKKRLKCWKRCA